MRASSPGRRHHAGGLCYRPNSRSTCCTTAIRLYVLLSDGGIRNGYTVKILNKLHEPQFHLGVDGIPGAALTIVGHEKESEPAVTVAPDELQSLRVYVTLDKANAAQLHDGVGDLSLVVTDPNTDRELVRHGFNFRGAPE